MRGWKVIVSAVAAGALATACSSGSTSDSSSPSDSAGSPPSTPSGVIRIAAGDAAATLDFMSTTNGSALEITNEVVEPLFGLDDSWTPQPLLVSDAQVSPDATSYKFTLRDVTFQNGDPLTAADVVASIQRWIVKDSRATKWFAPLTSLTAVDDHTVDFEFSKPFGVLESYLAAPSSGIIPASAAQAAGEGTLAPEQLIGTGPFALDNWDPGVKVTLKRYADYQSPDGTASGYAGSKEAHVEELDFLPVADASARLAGLQSGQYDYAESIAPDQLDALKSGGFQAVPRLVGPVAAYLNSTSTILTPEVRHAILTAIDMNEVGTALGPQDLWKLSPSLAPPGGALYSEAGTDVWNHPDVDKAKQMLSDAGYDGSEVTMISTSSPATYAMAIVLQQTLEGLGMKVNLQQMDTAAMQALRAEPTGWDIAMGQINRSADATQQSALYCGNTVGGYCSEEMNSLIEAFQQATTPETQMAAHEAVQEQYYKDLPFIMGPDLADLAGASASLQGFTPTQLPLPHFWNAWLAD